ncbi:restriction endonuclease subunit S [Desulfosporosinus hippei]|uniref:Type I restriction enzyme, S subunit n=1 Tax=Desulfosporosinus hippei DSM 8344 TaxID=1121419 RepID=A0A1G8L5E7_9FIRM|nr:restriction endonuclease subunit S [Desulfosporosinus hippei]SDI50862.1 type I restriction enzyme, S subunit [Desulfosporosinus hippei DSM 8344]
MKKYAETKLGELVQITGGGTPSRANPEYWGGEIPWVTVKDFTSKKIVTAQEKITPIGLKNSASNMIPAKSILMPTRMALGKIAINEIPVTINQDIKALQIMDIGKIHLEYLGLYLLTISNVFEKAGKGSTVKGIKLDFLKDIKIPLPPLDDQIRIATVLTQAEKLIAKRKESIKALDELLKSTFLEMFSLDHLDDKNWELESLSSNTDIVSGVTKGKKYKTSIFREVPYMRVANVQDGHLNLSEIKTIEVTEIELQRYKLRKGDLLLTEGGDPDKLGRGAVWNDEIDECIHQNHIFRVRVKNKSLNPVFLSALMASNYGKSYFLKAAKQTTGIASINSKQLKAFPLIKPPLTLQNQFGSIVEKVEVLKARYNKSLIELENLYGSLSQRAFKGELDLSKVPLVYKNETEESEITEIGRLDGGLKNELEFNDKDLVDLIKRFSGKIFSFDELWIEIESLTDKDIPLKNRIQEQIIDLLESDKENLQQVFDILSSEADKIGHEKQIAFRGNYEN